LYGTWSEGNPSVNSLRFSNGNDVPPVDRVPADAYGVLVIGRDHCSVNYNLDVTSATAGSLSSSGPVNCAPLLTGNLTLSLTVNDGTLKIRGASGLKGTYQQH
jgi:hypothetical protein